MSCSTPKEILTYAGDVGNSGYIDTNGKWIIKPSNKFSNKYQFSEGCAAVCTGFFEPVTTKWGYINPKGVFIIKPQFDNASPFSEGMAAVKMNNKWGYINKSGELVIDYKFDNAFSFRNGCATIQKDGLWGLIDKMGKVVIALNSETSFHFKTDTSLSLFKQNGLYGFINKAGVIVLSPRYKYATGFSDGLSAVSDGPETVFINKLGDTVISNRFFYTEGFKEGIAAVQFSDMRYKYIDTKGTDFLKRTWDYAGNFSAGLAIVTVNGRYGIINREGQFIIMPIHSYLSEIKKGFYSVGILGDTVINSVGKIIWTKTSR
jgi:hypothetical protein